MNPRFLRRLSATLTMVLVLALTASPVSAARDLTLFRYLSSHSMRRATTRGRVTA